jgi:hypothetical protein
MKQKQKIITPLDCLKLKLVEKIKKCFPRDSNPHAEGTGS